MFDGLVAATGNCSCDRHTAFPEIDKIDIYNKSDER